MSSHLAYPTAAARSTRLRTPTVCVVDPRRDDYSCWQSTASSAGVRLEQLTSAHDALRLARRQQIDLWVINAELPGESGLALCSMLKSQNDRATVYLVTDDYSSALEQSAWQARATLFGAKGSHLNWLSDWLACRSSAAAGNVKLGGRK